ncbi:hypothetical protein [Cellulosilyticum ruminicola]|uniref:hypothetical protein n=1 Tax=Cellulosilyticum ruminicola TaxID=425254 RepID=UPI0006CFD209|nr:hypothetical protein [Cellulosilyticum ruminicola]
MEQQSQNVLHTKLVFEVIATKETFINNNMNTFEDIIKCIGMFSNDLIKAHSYYKENPFTPTTEKCAELLATGEVGFWYMGNWASENLNKYAVIDKKYNSVGEQAPAKDFLNWLAYNQTATDFIINEAGLITGVLATDVQYTNSLSQSI